MKKSRVLIIFLCIVFILVIAHGFRAVKHHGFHELYILGKSYEDIVKKHGVPDHTTVKELKLKSEQNFVIWYEYNVPSLILSDNEYCIIHFKNGKASKVEFDYAPPGG